MSYAIPSVDINDVVSVLSYLYTGSETVALISAPDFCGVSPH